MNHPAQPWVALYPLRLIDKSFELFTLFLLVTLIPWGRAKFLHSLQEYPEAKCLDGSPAVYYASELSASSHPGLVLYFQAGGWCDPQPQMHPPFHFELCSQRAFRDMGSSKLDGDEHWPLLSSYSLLLSQDPLVNPKFHSWQKVFVRYCDGASFSGNVAEPVNGLYFKGRKILDALLEDLVKNRNLAQVQDVIITGCSAGGLTVFHHCDRIAEFLHQHAPRVKVRCHPDAGFFVDQSSILGPTSNPNVIRELYSRAVQFQNSSEGLNSKCLENNPVSPTECFFPEVTLPYIETPCFILNSAYDSWSIQHIWMTEDGDGITEDPQWKDCVRDLSKCDTDALQHLQVFYKKTLDSLEAAEDASKKHGFWVNSCFRHCQGGNLYRMRDGKTWYDHLVDWYEEKSFPKISDGIFEHAYCSFNALR
jgi:hypothetical protein